MLWEWSGWWPLMCHNSVSLLVNPQEWSQGTPPLYAEGAGEGKQTISAGHAIHVCRGMANLVAPSLQIMPSMCAGAWPVWSPLIAGHAIHVCRGIANLVAPSLQIMPSMWSGAGCTTPTDNHLHCHAHGRLRYIIPPSLLVISFHHPQCHCLLPFHHAALDVLPCSNLPGSVAPQLPTLHLLQLTGCHCQVPCQGSTTVTAHGRQLACQTTRRSSTRGSGGCTAGAATSGARRREACHDRW